MKKEKRKNARKKKKTKGKRLALLEAIATITGTAIGAGFLGIPYVFSKSGFFIGLAHLILLCLFVMLTNLCFGELILRTKAIHQLPGYISYYLGKPARLIMHFAMAFGIYGAIIAYLIGEGQVLSFIFTGSTASSIYFSIAFFALIALLCYYGISMLEKGETAVMFIVITISLVLAIAFLPKFNFQNISSFSKSPVDWFLPYGVVLFSYLCFSALPEVEQEIKGNEKVLKKAIIFGMAIPFFIYFIFTLAIVGFAGKATPEIATIALGKIPSLLAVFTMFTACFALTNAIRDMYELDLKIRHFYAWLLATFLPFLLFLLIALFKLAGFVKIIGITGAISGGLTGILILLAHSRAKLGDRKPEYSIKLSLPLRAALIIVFILGMIAEILF
ncbi:MAG: aromatic amino acid transport family protein [Candidatus Pacearchaeota archaeon]